MQGRHRAHQSWRYWPWTYIMQRTLHKGKTLYGHGHASWIPVTSQWVLGLASMWRYVTVQRDIVGYPKAINVPATQMSIVQQILILVMKIKDRLNLENTVCIFDQDLYAKPIEIKGKHKDCNSHGHVLHCVNCCQLLARDAALLDWEILLWDQA